MALKSLLLVSILVTGMAIPLVEAQLGGLGNLLGLIQIQGTVFCTANGNIGVNGTATPVFPNALVQLHSVPSVIAADRLQGCGEHPTIHLQLGTATWDSAVTIKACWKNPAWPPQHRQHRSCWIHPYSSLLTLLRGTPS